MTDGIMTLLGSVAILLLALALIVVFVLRTPRSIRNRERESLEAELAAVNDALGAFGRGAPIAFLRKQNGFLEAYNRADFSTLVEHKRRLLAQLRHHK